MSQRHEFVLLAQQPDANVRLLCRRFGISAKAGYKWLRRYEAGGPEALRDQPRRPKSFPRICPDAIAQRVIELRKQHPTWGGFMLRQRLLDLGFVEVPAASTCTEIVRRAGLIDTSVTPVRPYIRFERATPNELWQGDYKGDFATQSGARCHALTVLDDHSRFNLVLAAKSDQRGVSVQAELTTAFSLYGLPEAMLFDNGAPWGCSDPTCPYTTFTVWLLRLGIRVLHGRPYHPQTQGKEERFHRTLQGDLISQHTWRDLQHCQREFDSYRDVYNCERPHRSLGGATPITRYRPSPRSLPTTLPSIDYCVGTTVRVIRHCGLITFGGQTWYIGKPFAGLPIGLREVAHGHWEVFFSFHRLGHIDLTSNRLPKHTARSIYSHTD